MEFNNLKKTLSSKLPAGDEVANAIGAINHHIEKKDTKQLIELKPMKMGKLTYYWLYKFNDNDIYRKYESIDIGIKFHVADDNDTIILILFMRTVEYRNSELEENILDIVCYPIEGKFNAVRIANKIIKIAEAIYETGQFVSHLSPDCRLIPETLLS